MQSEPLPLSDPSTDLRNFPPPTPPLRRVVAKAEDGGGTSSGSEVKTSGKKWAAIDKFGTNLGQGKPRARATPAA